MGFFLFVFICFLRAKTSVRLLSIWSVLQGVNVVSTKRNRCVLAQIFLFTDVDCFNLEASLSFSSSALCVVDSFLLCAIGVVGYW